MYNTTAAHHLFFTPAEKFFRTTQHTTPIPPAPSARPQKERAKKSRPFHITTTSFPQNSRAAVLRIQKRGSIVRTEKLAGRAGALKTKNLPPHQSITKSCCLRTYIDRPLQTGRECSVKPNHPRKNGDVKPLGWRVDPARKQQTTLLLVGNLRCGAVG